MENQNAFNEEEYSAFRAETCTRIEIMNSQATSALTTALATWVIIIIKKTMKLENSYLNKGDVKSSEKASSQS